MLSACLHNTNFQYFHLSVSERKSRNFIFSEPLFLYFWYGLADHLIDLLFLIFFRFKINSIRQAFCLIGPKMLSTVLSRIDFHQIFQKLIQLNNQLLASK